MVYNSRPATWVTKSDTIQYEGTGLPSELMGSVGERYFDTSTNIWYVNRVVGRINGNDNIYIPAQQNIAPISKIECCFKTSPTFQSDAGKSDIFGSELVMKIRSSAGRIEILIGNNVGSGWVVAGEAITPILNNSTWYKIRIEVNNPAGIIKAFLNDELTYTRTGQSIETVKSGFRFGSIDMIPLGTLICNCRYNDTFLPICEGTGTILRNQNGSELGSLVDSSPFDFWTDSWVPINLSYPFV